MFYNQSEEWHSGNFDTKQGSVLCRKLELSPRKRSEAGRKRNIRILFF